MGFRFTLLFPVFGLLLCVLAVPAARAEAALHTFTTTDGRSLEASIAAYNQASKKIQVVRKDGKKVWVAPSVFCDRDRDYIRQWIAASRFMLPTKFRIKGKKIKKKAHTVKRPDRSTETTTEILYKISLENRTGTPIKDLRIEYRAFIAVKFPRGDIRVAGGHLAIPKIADKKSATREVKAATLLARTEYHYESSGIVGIYDEYNLKVYDENLKGFWVRVYGPEIDGERLVREWCSPPDTRKNFSWQEVSPAPPVAPQPRPRRRQPRRKPTP